MSPEAVEPPPNKPRFFVVMLQASSQQDVDAILKLRELPTFLGGSELSEVPEFK